MKPQDFPSVEWILTRDAQTISASTRSHGRVTFRDGRTERLEPLTVSAAALVRAHILHLPWAFQRSGPLTVEARGILCGVGIRVLLTELPGRGMILHAERTPDSTAEADTTTQRKVVLSRRPSL